MQNQNLEKSILSHLIFNDNKSSIFRLERDDFYYSVYQEVYTTIYNLLVTNRPIDPQIILQELDNRYENDILDITSTVPIASIDEYINELKNLRKKREIVEFSNSLKDKLDTTSLDETKELIYSQIEKLFSTESLIEIDPLDKIDGRDIEFILKDWLPIPKKTVTLFSAPGGSGKSWAILQLALRYLQENSDKKAFLWLSEDPKELSKKRAFNIAYDLMDIKNTATRNELFARVGISDSPAIQFLQEARVVEINKKFYEIKELLKDYELIIFDPLSAFFGVEENSNSNARIFMQLFTNWANKQNKIIIFLHHSTKHTTTARGASAFVDAVRLVYEIDFIKGQDTKRLFKITKDNYGAKKYLQDNKIDLEIFANIKNLSMSW